MRTTRTPTTDWTSRTDRTGARTGRGGVVPRTAIRGAFVTAAAAMAGALAFATVAVAPAGASSKTTTVNAVETDFHIALSKKTFAPGKYTFVAMNKGQTTHALEITGSGLKNAVTKDISPGQSTKLTVTFKKGPYDIFCPVPGHKMLGMNVNIVVGGSAATTSKTSGKTSGGSSGGSSNSSSGGSSGGYGY
ncbi:MAG TPA: plastocyanin/azurin family copper-binding protein [Acidimicrobiales bacterium]|nr:plastocyanin/azurin family copper-binding protein [Acidimicrobiales bacterium]